MKQVALRCTDPEITSQLNSALQTEASGFRVLRPESEWLTRRPFSSVLGDAAAIVGVVLSAAQLAAVIYQIRTSCRRSEAVKIELLVDEKQIDVTDESKECIEALLKQYECNGE